MPGEGESEREWWVKDEETQELLEQPDWEGADMAPITADDVAMAVKSFKGCTSKGYCGWHPKLWAQLPKQGLECLAKVLQLVEAGRAWPNSIRNINLIRIIKDSGGHRLIGILSSLYRVWGKVRRPACVEWESAHCDGSDYAMPGKSAVGAAWDFPLTNEAAFSTGGSTIAWQGDVENAMS